MDFNIYRIQMYRKKMKVEGMIILLLILFFCLSQTMCRMYIRYSIR
jgi:hypothetical protein